jgi:hypothetical protein
MFFKNLLFDKANVISSLLDYYEDQFFELPCSTKTVICLSNSFSYKISIQNKMKFLYRNYMLIKFKTYGFDSGINTTKCNFYIFVIPQNDSYYCYMIKTSKLKQMIKDHQYVARGALNFKKYYVFEYNTIFENSEII